MSLEQIHRDEWGRLLALLVAHSRRLDLAEDALAEAFEQAARVWPDDGTPTNPAGWLMTTAKRRITDRIRAEAMAARKQPLLAIDERNRVQDNESGDDLLRLVLLAAHPALAPEAGAALTLRLVLGVPTGDIAKLFLVSEPTMAARLTRARKKVVAAGIPLALPDARVLPGRLDTVAQVAYLAFTAGYAPGSGPDLVRVELAGEAIRLVRLMRSSSPVARASQSLTALLALMLLQHSRRDARVGRGGELVRLPDQQRSTWHQHEIAEGLDLLGVLTGRETSPAIEIDGPVAASYLLQALIAAEHARAARAQDTDWVTIADLYRQLEDLTGSPVVRLNRAVAVAEAGDLEAAMALADGLLAELPTNHRLHAVRAEFLTRAGRTTQAGDAYREAISLCANDVERSDLEQRLAFVADPEGQ
ncbi:RNA polymerase sigma factor [Calidifontibacter indicus]|uniref:RNA polymerase sigma factor n=1 Tax=Calidifontibacter indicus TaxID=419650 RepID=UPI003D745CFC